MSLRRRFPRRRVAAVHADGALDDLRGVFRVVYGREPTVDEEAVLDNLGVDPTDPLGVVRSVIGSFDHQVHRTPLTVRLRCEDVVFMETQEGFSLAVDAADGSVGDELLSGSGFQPYVSNVLKEKIKPGMVVVDVGTNVGFHAMLAAKLVGPSGRVLCVEPSSENCRLLLLSAEHNRFPHLTVYPVAVSDRQGFALFSSHIGSNGGLLPSSRESLLNPSCVVVPTFRLDDLITDHVDLIKIDVEGAEGLVVSGAKELLERHRPIVISEFSMEMLPRVSGMSGAEYLRCFHDLGYEMHVLNRDEGGLTQIRDPSAFLDAYGSKTRIEDLAFIPAERTGNTAD